MRFAGGKVLCKTSGRRRKKRRRMGVRWQRSAERHRKVYDTASSVSGLSLDIDDGEFSFWSVAGGGNPQRADDRGSSRSGGEIRSAPGGHGSARSATSRWCSSVPRCIAMRGAKHRVRAEAAEDRQRKRSNAEGRRGRTLKRTRQPDRRPAQLRGDRVSGAMGRHRAQPQRSETNHVETGRTAARQMPRDRQDQHDPTSPVLRPKQRLIEAMTRVDRGR